MALKSPAPARARPNSEHPDHPLIRHQPTPQSVTDGAEYLARLMLAHDAALQTSFAAPNSEKSRLIKESFVIGDEIDRVKDLVCGKAQSIDEALAQFALLMHMMDRASMLPWHRSTRPGQQARQMIRLVFSILDQLLAASDQPNIALIRFVMERFPRPDQLLADLVDAQCLARATAS